MSFLDTLKNLGLWQPQQAQQPNPYGLDPAVMSQARMAALGNIGGQLLAMSQQMTPDQRARMMANADWTGGYQGNLMNAAQMQLMGDSRKYKQLERERMARARSMIADRIKKAPLGLARDAAMYFFEAGDLAKAGEILFKRERRFNPVTAAFEYVDAFGQPVGGGQPAASPYPGGEAMPVPTAPIGTAPIPAPASVGVMPEAPVEASADPVTQRWRTLTKDPSLTPQEVQQMVMAAAKENDPEAAMRVYREIRKQQADLLNQERGGAERLRSDFDAASKGYTTVINAAENAERIAMQPNMTPADKLAVLYDYIKTLDPLGAVRDSDVELAQSIQPVTNQLEQMFRRFNEGGTVTDEAILQIARTMAGLGNTAKGRLGRKEMEIRRISTARGVNPDMIFGVPQRGTQGPPVPIGARIPRGAGDQAVALPPDDEAFISNWGGQ